MTVRIGVLGCADIARRRALPAIKRVPEAELVVVAARELSKARAFAAEFGCAAAEGYQSVLDRPDIGAVYIPLPTGLHHTWIERALAAGKHVLVEKPLTTRLVDTAAVMAQARSRGLVLMDNLTFLRHGVHHFVRRMVAAGEIGELRMVSGVFGFPPLPAGDIRYRPELGGGALLDLGVYPLSAARFFLPEEPEVVAATLREDPDRGVDVSGAALLCTPDGRTAQIAFGFEHSYRCEYQLWGSAGRIVVDRAYTPPPAWHPVVRVERQDETRELTFPAEDQFVNTMREFVRAVTAGQPAEEVTAIRARARLLDEVRDRARVLRAPVTCQGPGGRLDAAGARD
ncbi:Gfo/Idh/MocA family oxidoreductase [Micromonospora sp. KC207]|uniref:Gfo/Idh/MocA family protein n=1 Tax=Micromonospora sp. KC207 TaxID=2530377 RepID=UPI00104D33B3|nr:Gfo/Idh/MocA family oxidoreductase [Micromonospora sp. KC207]TDC67384.1 Gfo/Idh/MocA family oxidoreductase [Micromonospora sp. KC207]